MIQSSNEFEDNFTFRDWDVKLMRELDQLAKYGLRLQRSSCQDILIH